MEDPETLLQLLFIFSHLGYLNPVFTEVMHLTNPMDIFYFIYFVYLFFVFCHFRAPMAYDNVTYPSLVTEVELHGMPFQR